MTLETLIHLKARTGIAALAFAAVVTPSVPEYFRPRPLMSWSS